MFQFPEIVWPIIIWLEMFFSRFWWTQCGLCHTWRMVGMIRYKWLSSLASFPSLFLSLVTRMSKFRLVPAWGGGGGYWAVGHIQEGHSRGCELVFCLFFSIYFQCLLPSFLVCTNKWLSLGATLHCSNCLPPVHAPLPQLVTSYWLWHTVVAVM